MSLRAGRSLYRGGRFQLADHRSSSYSETLGPTCLPICRPESRISSWPVGMGHAGAGQSEVVGCLDPVWVGGRAVPQAAAHRATRSVTLHPGSPATKEPTGHLGLKTPHPGAAVHDRCRPFFFTRLSLLCPGPGYLTPRVLEAFGLQQVLGHP